MESTPKPTAHSQTDSASTPTTSAAADLRLLTITSLIDHLDGPAAMAAPPEWGGPMASPSSLELEYQNKLVQVRLGLASSLFVALRAKHLPTASHCLRVALGCSSWSDELKLSNHQRDELEIAALLHDIGKIGIPDRILSKPQKLNREEAATIDRHRAIGVQILLSCCASEEVLSIVKYAPAWYDGSRSGFDRRGIGLPWAPARSRSWTLLTP